MNIHDPGGKKMSLKDYSKKPFNTMIVLGESHVSGAVTLRLKERRWVQVTADLLSFYQGFDIKLYNKGIPANSISQRSPGYEASIKPSAMERYITDVIDLDPDLFILSYGLNDMRAGMHPESFRQDLRKIILDVKKACDPVIVLTTVYYMTDYTLYPPFDKGSIEMTEIYNLVIKQLAEENECILADIWSAEAKTDWFIHPDTVHANDLGHQIIGNRVFEAIATNCSCVAVKSNKNY